MSGNRETKSLARELQSAQQAYYTEGASDLTDAEYDEKLERLAVLDPSNPVVTRVGAKEVGAVPLPIRMGSLERKTRNPRWSRPSDPSGEKR